jgi:SAM-dependent methyltransferase
MRVLDIGCGEGLLLRSVPRIGEYVGIDPALQRSMTTNGGVFIQGWFPRDLPPCQPFDAIAMLAVLEHIPPSLQSEIATACVRLLKPGGRLLITVPSQFVDKILVVLRFTKMTEDMTTLQHYGLDVRKIPPLFSNAGFKLVRWRTFQLGLNNLFVFERLRRPSYGEPHSDLAS